MPGGRRDRSHFRFFCHGLRFIPDILNCIFIEIKRTSVQKSNKNEIFMARVKNSNCLKFCTQVDPSKTRKTVYFFPQMCFFSRKTNFSLSPSRIDGSGHNRSKIEHFRSLRISKILHLGKSYQLVLFHGLFVFCKGKLRSRGACCCACAKKICSARSAPFRYFQRTFAGFQLSDRHLSVIFFGEG